MPLIVVADKWLVIRNFIWPFVSHNGRGVRFSIKTDRSSPKYKWAMKWAVKIKPPHSSTLMSFHPMDKDLLFG